MPWVTSQLHLSYSLQSIWWYLSVSISYTLKERISYDYQYFSGSSSKPADTVLVLEFGSSLGIISALASDSVTTTIMWRTDKSSNKEFDTEASCFCDLSKHDQKWRQSKVFQNQIKRLHGDNLTCRSSSRFFHLNSTKSSSPISAQNKQIKWICRDTSCEHLIKSGIRNLSLSAQLRHTSTLLKLAAIHGKQIHLKHNSQSDSQ